MRHTAVIVLALSTVVFVSPAAAEDVEPKVAERPRTLAVELGLGGVSGLMTNSEYDRDNPGLFGTLVYEQPVSGSAWSYGGEFNIGSELAPGERGGFGYLTGGLRLAHRSGDKLGVWSAVRLGVGGHTSGQFATGFGAGLDYLAFGRVGVGVTADVTLLAPGYDSLLDEDLDAAAVGTVSIRAIGRFSL